MDSLQRRSAMSPWQLGIILLMTGIGSDMVLSTNKLTPSAGQLAWLVPFIAGGIYFGVAYLMIKLGELFPGESFISYFQHIWGRRITILLVWFFVTIMLVRSILFLQMFSKEIIFFMFDRTPPEVIILTLLGVSAYCAIQDLGTVLRVKQTLFFTALPMVIGIILLGFINFEFINIHPLWPINIAGLVKGSLESWFFYFGYESILWLLPWVYRGKSRITLAVGSAFALKGLLMAVAILMVIGSQSVEGVKATPYPTAVTIRSIELPGTFIERVDNYLYLAWIPLALCSIALPMFVVANVVAETYGYSDHQPFVLLFIPALFIGTMSLHDLSAYLVFTDYVHWPGLVFSFVVIPATYLVARWKIRRIKVETT